MTTPPSLHLTHAPPWVQRLQPASPQGPELIATERSKSNLSIESLSNFLFTSAELTKRRDILKILQREPVFDKSSNYFDGRVEKFTVALARAKRMRQLQLEHGWDHETYEVASTYLGEASPYGLHNR
jgi:acyl-CoA oxidase